MASARDPDLNASTPAKYHERMKNQQQTQAKPEAAHAGRKQMFDRANAEHAAGRSDEAEAICRALLAIDEGYFGAWHLRGIIALRSGDPAAALSLIERAVALAPKRADCRNSLGFVYKALDRRADAEAAFGEAVALDPDFVEAHQC
jgi:Flp pilus assembly protein TadD